MTTDLTNPAILTFVETVWQHWSLADQAKLIPDLLVGIHKQAEKHAAAVALADAAVALDEAWSAHGEALHSRTDWPLVDAARAAHDRALKVHDDALDAYRQVTQ